MSNQDETTTAKLPDYITSATPNPAENRAPWYKNTAPTYAGIFLWFVFWQDAATAPSLGGVLAGGVAWALASLVLAALICHFLFYLVPGLLGQKTGLPLYIVGTSTYGAQGGFLMPGFLMGVLQFGWLGVNTFFASLALGTVLPLPPQVTMVIWGVLAAFVGLKGIQYVARVATYLPLIPLAILVILFVKTAGSIAGFEATKLIEAHKAVAPDAPPALSAFGVLAFVLTYVVGFFATAGAAGVDFGTNSRDGKDVQMGGLVGIAAAIIVTAGPVHADRGRGLRLGRPGREGRGRRERVPGLHPELRQLDPGDPGGDGVQVDGLPAGRSRLPSRLLLVVHRRQQLQDDPAEGQPLHLGRASAPRSASSWR